MKRGLKFAGLVAVAHGASVKEDSPMKRGLKLTWIAAIRPGLSS